MFSYFFILFVLYHSVEMKNVFFCYVPAAFLNQFLHCPNCVLTSSALLVIALL